MDTASEASCPSVSQKQRLAKRRRSSRTTAAASPHLGTSRLVASRDLPPAARKLAKGRKRAKSLPDAALPRPTATFAVPELENAFVSFCQLTSHAPCSAADRESKRRELLGQVASHIHLPVFDSAEAERDICGSTLLEPLESDIDIDSGVDARSIYAKLCATRVLTAEEERSVMRRMHYFKYLAWQILSRESLSQWDLTRAQGLAKAALWHRDLMLQANMRLVVSVVKRLPADRGYFEELISDGALALLRAVDKFDPGRGFRFCTYATTVIRRECFLHIKLRHQDKRQRTEIAASPAIALMCDVAETTFESARRVGFDRTHWLAWRERLAGMMCVLTRREQVIIRARYCLGAHRRVKTLRRLSIALKISKERVRQIEIEALAKLRAAAMQI